MPWREDILLPGNMFTYEIQERTQVLRRQLQLTDGELATADAGDDNIQEGNVDHEMALAIIEIDDVSSEEESHNEPDPGAYGLNDFESRKLIVQIMHSRFNP
jgi:hypothetical protein